MPRSFPPAASQTMALFLHQSGLVVGEATSLLLPESCLSSSNMYSLATLRLLYPLLNISSHLPTWEDLSVLQAHFLIATPPLSNACMASIHCRWLFQMSWLLKSLNCFPPKISPSSLSPVATHFCGHSQDFAQWLHYFSNCKNVQTKLSGKDAQERSHSEGVNPSLIAENMLFHVPGISLLRILLVTLYYLVHISAFKSRICHMDFHSV